MIEMIIYLLILNTVFSSANSVEYEYSVQYFAPLYWFCILPRNKLCQAVLCESWLSLTVQCFEQYRDFQ